MTPHEIDLLMHYYTCADDHRNANHPGVIEALTDLAGKELIGRLAEPSQYGSNWKLTLRGETYCDALTQVPLPVLRWVMPGDAD
jgi:hypothetical protein